MSRAISKEMEDSARMEMSAIAEPAAAREAGRIWKHLFVITALLILAAGWLGLDRWFYEHVSLKFNTPDQLDDDLYNQTRWFWNTVRLWSHVLGVLIIYWMLVGFHRCSWRGANALGVAMLILGVCVQMLQDCIGRLRPDQADSAVAFARFLGAWRDGAATCFPSGEVTAAFALAVLMDRLWPRGRWAWYSAACLVALARLLPGRHYLSDAAAGALLGAWLAPRFFEAALFWQDRIWGRNAPAVEANAG